MYFIANIYSSKDRLICNRIKYSFGVFIKSEDIIADETSLELTYVFFYL